MRTTRPTRGYDIQEEVALVRVCATKELESFVSHSVDNYRTSSHRENNFIWSCNATSLGMHQSTCVECDPSRNLHCCRNYIGLRDHKYSIGLHERGRLQPCQLEL
mmetsp:Transcript_39049/g.96986  ORF Transcript_39049/g.96986 Transcript_39049/m.96986 type:complete len:105 (-) Transcript_39049:255-569(-)